MLAPVQVDDVALVAAQDVLRDVVHLEAALEGVGAAEVGVEGRVGLDVEPLLLVARSRELVRAFE